MIENLRSVRVGLLISIFTILFGFGLAVVFGAAEDSLKNGLKTSAESVLQEVYKGDLNKMNENLSKSWSYYKRAHIHGSAIGTTTLVFVILLSFLPYNFWTKSILAIATALGGFLYSTFWLYAGKIAPVLGSTSKAKHALSFWAIPAVILCIGGIVGITLLTMIALFGKKNQQIKSE